MAVNLGYMFSTKSKALDSDEHNPFKTASIIQYGISAGYTNTIRDENFDNLQLMPIAAVLRVYWLGVFSIGGSFGYAFALDPNTSESGAYGEATLGIGTPKHSVFFAVRGVNSSGDPAFEWSTMSLGMRFLLGKKNKQKK